ncbi:MAG: DUF2065 domain-containing protein [Pseudomonadota bacterium]|nr:DUF2065 domain-containing protein [Pseudomonadota bacterium]
MWTDLGAALCLVLIVEGIVPFLYPSRWRRVAESLAHLEDRQMRIIGFLSMIVGTSLLYFIR